jgi:hypothetical protein
MNRLTEYEQLQTPPASMKSIKQNMRRPATSKTRTDNRVHVPFVVASSHIGFQVVDEHERVVQRQDGIPSRWHQHATATAVDGDLPPAKPTRHTGGTAQNSKKSNQDENLAGHQRETDPRKARPKWLTQVFQPAPTETAPVTAPTAVTPTTTPARTVSASSTKKENASLLSPRQEEQRKDIPDCQPSRPTRQLRREAKCPAVVVSSDASNTHATEESTEHDDDGDYDDFDDDISDMTPEDYSEVYSESVIYSDSQSYIRPNNNSNSIPSEVSASKALDTNPDSNSFIKTTEGKRPALIASTALEPEPVDTDVTQEAMAAKYRKMLHMQVPKEAVRQKMMVDGVDPEIVRRVVGESAPATLPACTKKDTPTAVILAANAKNKVSKACVSQKPQAKDKDKSKNENKLVALHWTPLSGKDLDHSVWMANTYRQRSLTAQGSDFSKLVELFKKKPKTCLPLDGKGKKLSTFRSRSSAPRANLLDLSRCNSVAISLKQFKEFSPEDLRDIIAFLDPMQRIRGERVDFLRNILPTVSEARKVDAYDGNEDCLVPTEIFFRRVARIQRLDRKVEVIRAMEGFTLETAVLDKKLRLFCAGMSSSDEQRKAPESARHGSTSGQYFERGNADW